MSGKSRSRTVEAGDECEKQGRVSVPCPLLSRGGVAAPSIECCEATVDGADGVVLVNRLIFLTSTTPTPPRLRRGLVLERVINDAPSSRRDLNLVRCKVAIRAAWR